MTKLYIGISVPQILLANKLDTTYLSEYVSLIESIGYDSMWVQEQVMGKPFTLDSIAMLSYLSAISHKARIGVAILVTALASPVHLAKSLATIDQLSKGRLTVGVGLGGYTGSYPAFGISAKTRVSRFEEGIKLIKELWTKDGVNFQGKFWQMENASVNPKPVQKPYPPLLFGGSSPPALKRAVKMGDTWMGAGSTSTQSFIEQTKLIKQYLREEGKTSAEFPTSKRVYMVIDKDPAVATRKLHEWSAYYYGNPNRAGETAIAGTVQQCIDGLGPIVETGVSGLLLNPVVDFKEHAEILWRDVVPKL
ncbi:MAG: LLM class flavin-dependent oxidoreductase [Dehalococcoidia bacterium]|nr:LLM class flavin-dependent oxidoreductase [Dehalococcoidia bacterium]